MLVGIIPIGLHRGALAEFSFGLTVLVYILVGSCVSVFVVGLRDRESFNKVCEQY